MQSVSIFSSLLWPQQHDSGASEREEMKRGKREKKRKRSDRNFSFFPFCFLRCVMIKLNPKIKALEMNSASIRCTHILKRFEAFRHFLFAMYLSQSDRTRFSWVFGRFYISFNIDWMPYIYSLALCSCCGCNFGIYFCIDHNCVAVFFSSLISGIEHKFKI